VFSFFVLLRNLYIRFNELLFASLEFAPIVVMLAFHHRVLDEKNCVVVPDNFAIASFLSQAHQLIV